MVTARGSAVSVDRIVESLWGTSPPRSCRVMVREHVKKVRAAVGPDASSAIASGPGGYRIDLPPSSADATVFEHLVTSGTARRETGDFRGAATFYERGLAQWRDVRSLVDVRDVSALEADAVHLDETRFQTELWLVECLLMSGRADQAMPRLLSHTVRHPERERFWALLMVAQCAVGRRLEARSTFRHARQAFLEQDVLDLSPEMFVLNEAVLAGTPVEHLLEITITPSSRRWAATGVDGHRRRADEVAPVFTEHDRSA